MKKEEVISKLSDPIFSEIKNKNVAKGILLTLLMTDGSVCNRKIKGETHIKFYNKDEILHKLFKEVMTKLFDRQPTLYIYPDKRVYVSSYVVRNHSKILKEIYKLSTTYNTKGVKGKEPTIKFILNKSKKIKILCFKVAMSTEGCISINKYGKTRLRFGCSNPKLVSQWKMVVKDIGIDMNITKDKNVWSSIQGLNTDKFIYVKKFIKLGGFINGCKAYKSKYHKNWEKNRILIKAYQSKEKNNKVFKPLKSINL